MLLTRFSIGCPPTVCSSRRISRVTSAALSAAMAIGLSGLSAMAAGGSDVAANDPAGVEFFEKEIRPLLAKHCAECHSAEEANGSLTLDWREAILKGGDSGPAVVPGKPDESLLIEAVRYKNRDLQMPPQNSLQPAEIAALEKWVSLGLPDPRQPVTEDSTGKPVGMSVEDGRDFWSFQPVSNPQPPTVKTNDWVKTPIDAFILADLEEKDLQPAPPADKRTLLRRVTFDLTGLPPTPEEVAAFLADEEPDAFQKVVERLLASPDYGIRWGRHWLDVARYADSNGLDENLAFGNAWRYRDYVVDAFNNDKPFDRFVVEQIAGDLLPEANRETRIATGYLALGARVLAEPDREKLSMDTIDEQLDTLGKTFLGMTFGCVRCHDHKFDPVKQTDYYALAAIFKSTQPFATSSTGAIKHWYEHSFATEEELEAIKKVNAEIAEKNKAASTYKNQAMARIRDEARSKAAEYLAAAAGFEPSMSLKQVEQLAAPLGLHPRILHHCRLHLKYHSDDPLFGPGCEVASERGEAGMGKHYSTLFADLDTALAEARKEDPKAKTLKDERLEQAREALYDTSGFLAVPPKPEFAFDAETLAEYDRLMEVARVFESAAPDEPAAMGVADAEEILTELPLHIRGSHNNLGQPVAREFPEVMRISAVRPIFPKKHSGRLQLAEWLASTQHPLTARVYVNRIWRWHFGEGIVASPDNFGVLGSRPSHPELLDWLAHHFMENGWSTKDMHRLILSSSVYQMATTHPAEMAAQSQLAAADASVAVQTVDSEADSTGNPASVDPENKLLWKFHVQRLEAEQIRDALLAVSGRLDREMGGKTVPLRNRQFVFNHTSVDHTKYDSLRRAIYLPVIRNNLYTMFEQFDFPDPTMPTGSRNATVVAPQALLIMNDELVKD